jgi:hypothetical protein
MAATTNGAGIARLTQRAQNFTDTSDTIRYAQSNFLDELPGFAFALITLVYLVSSLVALV